MNSISQFFHWCSGATPSVLKRYPTEHSRYVGIGGSVLFTGILAAVSSGYAISIVFNNIYISIAVGLLWGMVIFNLDRYIVSGISKGQNNWEQLKMALPRLILAIFIAVVISKPLELKMFGKEIENELILIEQEKRIEQELAIEGRYNFFKNPLIQQYDSLALALALKEKEVDRLSEESIKEADGTGGTMQRNAGPIYKLKKERELLARKEVEALKANTQIKLQQLSLKIDSIEAKKAIELQGLSGIAFDGLAARLEAHQRLRLKSQPMAIASWFILFLFILVECTPVLLKLMSRRGPYDDRIEIHEYSSFSNRTSTVARLTTHAKNSTREMEATETEYVETQLKKWLRS